MTTFIVIILIVWFIGWRKGWWKKLRARIKGSNTAKVPEVREIEFKSVGVTYENRQEHLEYIKNIGFSPSDVVLQHYLYETDDALRIVIKGIDCGNVAASVVPALMPHLDTLQIYDARIVKGQDNYGLRIRARW